MSVTQTVPGVYFVYYDDLLKFYRHLRSKSGAHAKYAAIKECLGKKKHQHLTVKEFAEWSGIDEEQIILALAH